MRFRQSLGFAFLAAVTSCGPQRQPDQAANNRAATISPALSAPPTTARTESPPEQTAKPPARAIDPKSTEAAVQLVRQFARLLNERKFDEAYMLLGSNAPPRNEFDGSWGQFDTFTVRVGTPGEQEGAAGSIYLSVPLNVSAVGHGEGIHLSPTVIVRRVNDVPGSTEAQRHWHIERIDRQSSR